MKCYKCDFETPHVSDVPSHMATVDAEGRDWSKAIAQDKIFLRIGTTYTSMDMKGQYNSMHQVPVNLYLCPGCMSIIVGDA